MTSTAVASTQATEAPEAQQATTTTKIGVWDQVASEATQALLKETPQGVTEKAIVHKVGNPGFKARVANNTMWRVSDRGDVVGKYYPIPLFHRADNQRPILYTLWVDYLATPEGVAFCATPQGKALLDTPEGKALLATTKGKLVVKALAEASKASKASK